MSGGQRLADDPVTWAKERANVRLWSKQRDIANTLVEHKRTYKNSTGGTETGQWALSGGTAHWTLTLAAFRLPGPRPRPGY